MTMRPAAPIRPSRRSAKGQAMAIFALVSVLLFVVAGLAVDAGTSYLTSNQLERAAAAAALAGVAYLPGDQPDAINAALVEAARDGFTNAGTGGTSCPGNPSPCVLTSFPQTNQMKVQISVSVSTIFLRLVGFGNHTVVRSETAEYLPPISLGQPGAQQGSAMNGSCIGLASYCANPPSGLGSSGNYYFEREEGWGNPRSEGDPFTPSPAEGVTGCGLGGSDNCSAASAPDFHQISPEAGTETQYPTLNYQGGSNYLIEIPNSSQSADLQIYNPAFAPDTCGAVAGVYCYHENDGSFGGSGSPYTSYSAIAYTLFKVTTLSSRFSDSLVSQEVFYPYNATNASAGNITYFPHCPACTPSATTVSYIPTTYHQWVSAINYTPINGTDQALFADPTDFGNNYLTDSSSTVPAYYRLEVDTLQWNGLQTCSSSACTIPATGTNTASEAHKGYAVRLVSDVGSPTPHNLGTLGASPGSTSNSFSACPTATPTCGTVSSMDDMTVFTPVNGANATQFSIPLFSIDPTAYAGQTINVDLFDVGDVGGGAAYVGLQAPDGTWPTVNSITNLGASLGGASPPGGGSNVTAAWPVAGCNTACYQTAASGGGAIYNGQWIQLQMTVTSSATGYYNLVYNVNAAATAADTFSVEVGFSGSPDHLLP
jgi:Flp pilus assembly protein TadG